MSGVEVEVPDSGGAGSLILDAGDVTGSGRVAAAEALKTAMNWLSETHT